MVDTPLFAATPWSSSTFGWSGHMVQDGKSITFTATDNAGRAVVPLFTIGAADAADAGQLVAAAKRQTLTDDVHVLPNVCADLAAFCATIGRYAIYALPGGGTELARCLAMDPKLLLRLAIVLFRYQPSMFFLRVADADCAVVLDRSLFLGRYWFTQTDRHALVADLHRYMTTLGGVGRYTLDAPRSAPTVAAPPPAGTLSSGYWYGPLARPQTVQDRHVAQVCLNAYPSFLATAARPGLWTCLANDWYDHRRILLAYIGLEADIQVYGKVQHGWQSGCGIDGERGYKPESFMHGFPVFLWNRRNVACAKQDGLSRVTPIGAPFLYRDNEPDPGPASRTLLCFPYHSVPEYPIAADWSAYGHALQKTAADLGFAGAAVCLHANDMDNDATLESLRATGLDVTTAGPSLDPFFMARLVQLIREHAAVTSDRICTAGLYAEALGRPFFLSGAALQSNPPDPDEGYGADRAWIAREMPEFLSFTGATHREVALRELGAEFIHTPDALRDLLYGWYL